MMQLSPGAHEGIGGAGGVGRAGGGGVESCGYKSIGKGVPSASPGGNVGSGVGHGASHWHHDSGVGVTVGVAVGAITGRWCFVTDLAATGKASSRARIIITVTFFMFV